MTPRQNGNRAKVDPRRFQEVIFSLLNFNFDFGSIFPPFWLPKCHPLGTQFAAQIAPKKNEKLERPKSHPKPPQFRLKTAQDRLKRLQEAPKIHFCSAVAPKMLPSGCLFVPKWLPESVKNRSAPKAPHNHLKFTPRRLKILQRDSKRLPRESQHAQK